MQEFLIYRTSPVSGKRHSMSIMMQYGDYLKYLKNEALIQDALPYLSADQREFIKTGITASEWDNMFEEEATYFTA